MSSQYDHDGRIKRLENKVNQLTNIVEAAGLLNSFVPLSQAAKQLNCNPWVIRDRLKKDCSVILGIHYKLNGNRYLISVDEWQKLIDKDAVEIAKRR